MLLGTGAAFAGAVKYSPPTVYFDQSLNSWEYIPLGFRVLCEPNPLKNCRADGTPENPINIIYGKATLIPQ